MAVRALAPRAAARARECYHCDGYIGTVGIVVIAGMLILAPAALIIFGGEIGLMIGLIAYGCYLLLGCYLYLGGPLPGEYGASSAPQKQSAQKQIFVIHIQDAEANPHEVMLRTEAQKIGRRPWEPPRGPQKFRFQKCHMSK